MEYHKPVLLTEILEFLNVTEESKYIDCNLGDGGHTLEIVKRGGKVLGIDLDPKSIVRAQTRITEAGYKNSLICHQGNFKDLSSIANTYGFNKVSGILFDLGFSSSQLLDEDIGLSFQTDNKLNMRLDPTLEVTAADFINALPEKALIKLFREYGEERHARRFAEEIVRVRALKKIESTKDLVEILVAIAPSGYERGRIHPATKVFQALRIAVNSELQNLEESLPRAVDLLLPGARMAIISFHSLEDKMVKDFGRKSRSALNELTKKPIVPSGKELVLNPRARSAKLRIFERNNE